MSTIEYYECTWEYFRPNKKLKYSLDTHVTHTQVGIFITFIIFWVRRFYCSNIIVLLVLHNMFYNFKLYKWRMFKR